MRQYFRTIYKAVLPFRLIRLVPLFNKKTSLPGMSLFDIFCIESLSVSHTVNRTGKNSQPLLLHAGIHGHIQQTSQADSQ